MPVYQAVTERCAILLGPDRYLGRGRNIHRCVGSIIYGSRTAVGLGERDIVIAFLNQPANQVTGIRQRPQPGVGAVTLQIIQS